MLLATSVQCRNCHKAWRLDDRCRQGIALANDDQGWIEKCFWREHSMRPRVLAFHLPVVFALNVLKFTWPLVLLLIPIAGLRHGALSCYLVPGGILGLGLLFLLLRYLDKAARRWFPFDFAGTPFLFVSSRGIVDVATYSTALLVPWSCIVGFDWLADPGQSSFTIHYATQQSATAALVIHGEEWEQPLGELVDIIRSHRPDLQGSEHVLGATTPTIQ